MKWAIYNEVHNAGFLGFRKLENQWKPGNYFAFLLMLASYDYLILYNLIPELQNHRACKVRIIT